MYPIESCCAEVKGIGRHQIYTRHWKDVRVSGLYFKQIT